MTYEEAKHAAVSHGCLIKRSPWELSRVGYDCVRETLFCEYEGGERRKFVPNEEEKQATDWVYA